MRTSSAAVAPLTDIVTLLDAFVVTLVFAEKPSALVATDALAGPVLLDFVSIAIDVIAIVQPGGGVIVKV